MSKFLLVFFLIVAFALPCQAQGVDPQTRVVFHTTVDFDENWFLTNWTIGNVKANNPDNINIFPGIGYRGSNWWFEAMIQRQWSKPSNSWALDFRFQTTFGKRIVFYAESSPFLRKTGEYEFVFIDVRVWKGLGLGAETENVHKPGADSIGAGPRASIPIASLGQYKLSAAGVYQFRHNERGIPRLYLILNRRFKP